MINLHTKSRDNLYEATAVYNDGTVTVFQGSRINNRENPNFKPSKEVVEKLKDTTIVGNDGILKKDVTFTSLSTAASFVAGRVSNGMITWKTNDGKYVRYTLQEEK